MKNHYFRYKLLLSLVLVFFISIFCYINTVFGATSFDDTMYYPEGITVDYTSSDAGLSAINKVLYNVNDTYYLLIICNNGVTHDTQKLYVSGEGIYCTYSGKLLFTCRVYDKNTSKWNYYNYWDTGCGSYSSSNLYKQLAKGTIISSSANIYTDSSCSKIFFLPPPQVKVTTIAQVEELPKVIMGIMKVIIPIGLVILLIGLLIYVIKSVISRAA